MFVDGDTAGRCWEKDGEGTGRRKSLNREKEANERTGKLTRGRSAEHRKERGAFFENLHGKLTAKNGGRLPGKRMLEREKVIIICDQINIGTEMTEA